MKADKGKKGRTSFGQDVPDQASSRSEQESDAQVGSEPAVEESKGFNKHQSDWFKAGRYFMIRAPGDYEIDGKEFILLGSNNSEGKGVRVDKITDDNFPSGATRYLVAILNPRDVSSDEEESQRPSSPRAKKPLDGPKFEQIVLADVGRDSGPLGDRYVRLDHTYNIPFIKYECKDLGILEDTSLDELRVQYIKYCTVEWKLVSQVRAALESDRSLKTSYRPHRQTGTTTPESSIRSR